LSVRFLRSLLALPIFKPTWNVIFQAELEGKPSDIKCLQRTQNSFRPVQYTAESAQIVLSVRFIVPQINTGG